MVPSKQGGLRSRQPIPPHPVSERLQVPVALQLVIEVSVVVQAFTHNKTGYPQLQVTTWLFLFIRRCVTVAKALSSDVCTTPLAGLRCDVVCKSNTEGRNYARDGSDTLRQLSKTPL
ncbi:hypothetical protein NDU88_003370 [Pleurodeles waltl]|uniref:Uncharacterized protein n=1 Tax=Pleurodeles waltl TaxID=8319 RepID=A0AAV7RGD9_PLEWA|nr:hypothetical protein NDU88_003370 [Pleurodeles waltl]